MLVLRLLLMILTIICLMAGHAEVSSSTTGMRNGGENPAANPNEPVVQILNRKKKPKKPKKPKKTGKKKGKKTKPSKPKPKPTEPVATTPLMTTSTLKTTTILTTPTTTTKTTPTTSPPAATTTEATTPTASTITTAPTKTTTTIATTSSPPTTAATTADSGAGGECKATNGNPCIFPFKDGNTEYNECKNHGGKYFWCATSVYDSGKYKHWSYCPKDGACPLEGDGECRATNNKPCVFPFKDGKKEYNECADHGGKYFWCATGTNSAGKYTAWSKCPKDGSCPFPQKSTTPVMTPTATAATTTLLTTGTSTAPDEIENKVVSSLKDLVKEESKDGTLEMLEAMNKITETIIEDLKEQSEDNDPKNIESNHTFEGGNLRTQELSLGYKQGVKSGKTKEINQNFEFVQNTVSWYGSISPVSDASGCCSECQSISSDAAFFDYSHYFGKCYCYKILSTTKPLIRENNRYSAGLCGTTTEDKCCETLTLSASGGAAQHQGHRPGTYKKDGEYNNKPVYKQQDGTNVLYYFRESNQFRWSFASSLSSGGGLSSKLGDASVCPSDVKIWQYYWPGTNNLWLVDSTVAVDCEEDCRAAEETDCPTQHTFLEGGFTKIPYDGMLDSTHDVDTKCGCRHLCDVRPTECKAFLFKTCSEGLESRCILLNTDKPSTTTAGRYKKYFAFCRRDRLVKEWKNSRNNGSDGGRLRTYELETLQQCNAVAGTWSAWGDFTRCIPNCGPGIKSRWRMCLGPPCSDSNEETIQCSLGECDKCPEEGAFHSIDKEACTCGKLIHKTKIHCKRGEHCLKYVFSLSCHSPPNPGVETHLVISPKDHKNCRDVCTAKNLYCNEESLWIDEKDCAKLKEFYFPKRTCKKCKPIADSTDPNCFPGARENFMDNSNLYYNTAYASNGYKCHTKPGNEVTTVCSCLPDCEDIRGKQNGYPRSNACLCNGIHCKDGHYCDKNNVCQAGGTCFDGWRLDFQGYSPTFNSEKLTRVISGDEVLKTTSWPWIANVYADKAGDTFSCTGVLVSCKHIITALHCLTYKKNHLDQYLTVVGEADIKVFLKTIKQGQGVEFIVNKITYKKKSQQIELDRLKQEKYDIVVLELKDGINPFTVKHEDIIPIPTMANLQSNGAAQFLSNRVFIAGFGGGHEELHQTKNMKFLKNTDNIFGGARKIGPENLIVVGPPKEGVSTQGDSGGPVMVLKDDSATSLENFILAGLVQRGINIPQSALTSQTKPGDRRYEYIVNLNHYAGDKELLIDEL